MATRKAAMKEEPESGITETEEVEVIEEDLEEDETGKAWDTFSMDPEEEVWPGGPKIAQVNKWKEQYGRVYVTDFLGEFYAWRTLTRFEYRRLVQNLEQAVSSGQISQAKANLDNEESITEMCVLYPKYDRTSPAGSMAGVATTLSQQIMEASAFSATDVREL